MRMCMSLDCFKRFSWLVFCVVTLIDCLVSSELSFSHLEGINWLSCTCLFHIVLQPLRSACLWCASWTWCPSVFHFYFMLSHSPWGVHAHHVLLGWDVLVLLDAYWDIMHISYLFVFYVNWLASEEWVPTAYSLDVVCWEYLRYVLFSCPLMSVHSLYTPWM